MNMLVLLDLYPFKRVATTLPAIELKDEGALAHLGNKPVGSVQPSDLEPGALFPRRRPRLRRVTLRD